jgi:hypothetical protein
MTYGPLEPVKPPSRGLTTVGSTPLHDLISIQGRVQFAICSDTIYHPFGRNCQLRPEPKCRDDQREASRGLPLPSPAPARHSVGSISGSSPFRRGSCVVPGARRSGRGRLHAIPFHRGREPTDRRNGGACVEQRAELSLDLPSPRRGRARSCRVATDRPLSGRCARGSRAPAITAERRLSMPPLGHYAVVVDG